MATSRLINCHLDMLNALSSVQTDGKRDIQYVNVWNKYYDDWVFNDKENAGYSFKCPATFIEFIPGDCKMIGVGVSSYPNTVINLHIFHMKLNSNGGGMERNLDIITLRDKIKQNFVGFGITGCSNLMCCADKLDYAHKNITKYILSFNTNFLDTKGSIYDVDSGATWQTLSNPTITIPQLNLFGVSVYYNPIENAFYIKD